MKLVGASGILLLAAGASARGSRGARGGRSRTGDPPAYECTIPQGISFDGDVTGKITWASLNLPWDTEPPAFGIFQVGTSS